MSSIDEKKALRQAVLARRDRLSSREIETRSRRIKKRLFSLGEFQKAKTVLFFVSFRSEVSTHEMIREASTEGKRIVLPRVATGKRLELFEIKNIDRELTPGLLGILEPVPSQSRKVPPVEIDLVIVPGIAFEPRGYRLGYGRGYFDRLLAELDPSTTTIGLGFELQIVKALPVSTHDIPVQKIVTEKRVIDCNLRRQ